MTTEFPNHRKETRMIRNTLTPNPNLYALFEEIARDVLWIETLETQNDDALDYHVVAVWSVCKALQRAYDLGRQSSG